MKPHFFIVHQTGTNEKIETQDKSQKKQLCTLLFGMTPNNTR
jgi:hypothetical protein